MVILKKFRTLTQIEQNSTSNKQEVQPYSQVPGEEELCIL